jgi:hypothetical protein
MLEFARLFALPLVEYLKTVAQAIPNGKYRIQKTGDRMKKAGVRKSEDQDEGE